MSGGGDRLSGVVLRDVTMCHLILRARDRLSSRYEARDKVSGCADNVSGDRLSGEVTHCRVDGRDIVSL